MNRHERRRMKLTHDRQARKERPLVFAALDRAHIVQAVCLTVMAQTQSMGFGKCATYAGTAAALLTTLTHQPHHMVVGALTYQPNLLTPACHGHIDYEMEAIRDGQFHSWVVSPRGEVIDVTVQQLSEHWHRTKPAGAPAWDRPDLPAFVWGDAAAWGLQYTQASTVDQAFHERWLLLEGKTYLDHLRAMRDAVRGAESILRAPGDWRLVPNGDGYWGVARFT